MYIPYFYLKEAKYTFTSESFTQKSEAESHIEYLLALGKSLKSTFALHQLTDLSADDKRIVSLLINHDIRSIRYGIMAI